MNNNINNLDPCQLAMQAAEAVLLRFTSEGVIQPEYLNTQQAAIYLGMSKQTLEIWRCHGCGPEFHKLSQMVRYKRSTLDEFMNTKIKTNTINGGANAN